MKFGFSPSHLEKALLEAVNSAVGTSFKSVADVAKRVTEQGYAKAQELASQRLHSQRQRYIDALSFEDAGSNIYTIALSESAFDLEEGYQSYDMIASGLARGPKSFVTKNGKRMVIIPFQHSKGASSPNSTEHNVRVQIGQPSQTTKGSLAADLKRLERAFGVAGTQKGPTGTAMTGKVWSMRKSTEGPKWHMSQGGQIHTRNNVEASSLLSGLVKVQHQQPLKSGKSRTQSTYFTFRTAVDGSSGKWVHPGFKGVHILKEVETWMTDQFAKEINDIFSK